MSLEHSPARQDRIKAVGPVHNQGPRLNDPAPEVTPADNLLIGAEAIARYVYGKADTKQIRDIYRNVFGFSLFKHGAQLAALKTTINAELAEKQRLPKNSVVQKKAPAVIKPHRPRSRRRAEQQIAISG